MSRPFAFLRGELQPAQRLLRIDGDLYSAALGRDA